MNQYDYSIYYRNWHDESREHHAAMSRYMAGQIAPHLQLPKSASILDVGCGFGFALGGLRLLGYTNIRGVDQSAEQAAACERAGFDVEHTDDTIDWLSTHRELFDGIVLFDVLEHVPVPLQIDFLRAIHRALKPGGQLLLTVPNANSILAARWRYNDYTHYSSFTEYSLAFVLKNAEFAQVSIDNSKGLGRFPKRALLKGQWPVVRKWIVRWCWLQVFKAEQPANEVEQVSFELNLTATAIKAA
jgi:2-polyprenyl-3-methyl-5-hydroxy-6-metoxy-1,4-benzoquinol methylase